MLHADAEHLDSSSALVRLRGDLDQDSVPVRERSSLLLYIDYEAVGCGVAVACAGQWG
ncbi:hypothetical protein [Streptomyces sp. CB03911]|uniref:hypothetical protein n=1 Tax=Streptomyces sp. CB03911 TaxID=1804758 RepID=UPI0018FE46B5|nr:hypothetical protein [Streptomyces sp. CB03911]